MFDFGKLNEEEASTAKTHASEADKNRFMLSLKKEKMKIIHSKQHKLEHVQFGPHQIKSWYISPFPQEFASIKKLFMCQYCLNFMNSEPNYLNHLENCEIRHPPGKEIYRDGEISVFEVRGHEAKLYCQNLCLLAKLFLDTKALYHDVDPFLFYVLTRYDGPDPNTSIHLESPQSAHPPVGGKFGCKFIGYFSKEMASDVHNLSCICVLPIYQNLGYGQYLIDFSYMLYQVEKKQGTPEKPLSHSGCISYRSYWKFRVAQKINECIEINKPFIIKNVAMEMGMTVNDVVFTLHNFDLLVNKDGKQILKLNKEWLDIQKRKSMMRRTVKRELLSWTSLTPPTNPIILSNPPSANSNGSINGIHVLK
eukprot:NODE_827_length_3663_cov_1.497755.p1 type:complete len:365 gc:universal NODE_827_length_3663_cov_1.497755:3170-2076(-)